MSDTATAASIRQGKLHRFEGLETIGTKIAITNAGDGLSRAVAVDPIELSLGQTVHVVLECTVAKVAYEPVKDAKDSVMRIQTLRAGTATIVDGDLVSEHLEAQAIRIEQAEGKFRLEFVTDDDDDEMGG